MLDLLVIGAGPAGYEAAACAGRMGAKVALVEEKYIGGTCLHIGCIPTKLFLKAAEVKRLVKNGSTFGLKSFDVPIDMPVLQGRKKSIIETLVRGIEIQQKKAHVDVIRGRAKIIDKHRVDVNGQHIAAQNILIASGSQPAQPPIPGLASGNVVDSTAILNIEALPASIAIIGGGYIGLEFACFFSAAGTHVTVIEKLPRIVDSLDADVAPQLLADLQHQGITFHLSSAITKIEKSTIYFNSDGQEHAVRTDIILNAAGRMPVVHNLGLEDVGVDFDTRGIKVDQRGKTNIPSIWACGDVTGRCLLAHAATREGIVAVNNMFGRKDYIRYHTIPAVIYTHPQVASIGFTEAELVNRGIEYEKALVPLAVAGRAYIEEENPRGFVKVLAGTKYGELLGIHIIGDTCGDFICAASCMMALETRIQDVHAMVFPHPTLSEALREAILHLVK
ncbi:dihydrolipoyl dehydrogenase [candidate division KSB1 bacterium]|nr:dihydrolipoyl dehydrogenase [candidate division KSB1 bacterium]